MATNTIFVIGFALAGLARTYLGYKHWRIGSMKESRHLRIALLHFVVAFILTII